MDVQVEKLVEVRILQNEGLVLIVISVEVMGFWALIIVQRNITKTRLANSVF